jgi:hypothetical protein
MPEVAEAIVREASSARSRLGVRVALALIAALAPAAHAQAPQPEAAAAEPAPSSSDAPHGIVYTPGRGLSFGNSGLTLGGFSTIEIDREDGEPAEFSIDSVNFLVSYEPVDALRFFAELEVDGLLELDSADWDATSDPGANFERLYVDFRKSDALNLRVGKFQTPVGRWNQVAAEPFVWTPEEPITIDAAFEEHQTGLALYGSRFHGSRTLSYWVYGQVVDAFDVPDEQFLAERSVGGRLEYADARGDWTLGTSYLASERDGAWSHLGGIDAQRRFGALELSSELTIEGGDIPGRDLWGVHLQGVYDLAPLASSLHGLYAVARYEHFDPSPGQAQNAIDAGLTWLPRDWLNLKLGYRYVDHQSAEVRRGILFSISVLF